MSLTEEETKQIEESIEAYENAVKYFQQLIEDLKNKLKD
jgi:hypothetical protein|tara:strand:- start:312 stop:428 length:117 start_codon:yes stop_codon:yes gene_type:complete